MEPLDIQRVISEQDFDESFYFEFKEDRVSNKKITEEISAFANTFEGGIFFLEFLMINKLKVVSIGTSKEFTLPFTIQ